MAANDETATLSRFQAACRGLRPVPVTQNAALSFGQAALFIFASCFSKCENSLALGSACQGQRNTILSPPSLTAVGRNCRVAGGACESFDLPP